MKYKSQVIVAASGSTGGSTYSHNSGGQYIRNRSLVTNRNTAFQAAVRAALATLASRWAGVLTPAQRTAWNLFGATITRLNKLGDPIHLSGIAEYIRSNSVRIQVGLSIVDDGPTTFTDPEYSGFVLNGFSAAAQAGNVSFSGLDAWNAAGGGVAFWMSSPLSAGRTFVGGPFRFAEAFTGGGVVSPQNVNAPFVIALGQVVALEFAVMTADGRMSNRSRLGPQAVQA